MNKGTAPSSGLTADEYRVYKQALLALRGVDQTSQQNVCTALMQEVERPWRPIISWPAPPAPLSR